MSSYRLGSVQKRGVEKGPRFAKQINLDVNSSICTIAALFWAGLQNHEEHEFKELAPLDLRRIVTVTQSENLFSFLS